MLYLGAAHRQNYICPFIIKVREERKKVEEDVTGQNKNNAVQCASQVLKDKIYIIAAIHLK